MQPKGWRTVACNLPPADYAALQTLMMRDNARLGTLVREAVQAYVIELTSDGRGGD